MKVLAHMISGSESDLFMVIKLVKQSYKEFIFVIGTEKRHMDDIHNVTEYAEYTC